MELYFWVAHAVAILGWLALLTHRPNGVTVARSLAIILLLCYVLLFVASAQEASELLTGYSLDAVMRFFRSPFAALLGWVHYLAFDLWIGTWEYEEASRLRMGRWMVQLSLVLTFAIGPVGLLIFLGLRHTVTGSTRPLQPLDEQVAV